MVDRHRHTWTLLYSHFGPYGDQDAHMHQCFDCGAILVGKGRTCDGKRKGHRVVAEEKVA
jgi:hypothetical protein